MIQYPGEEIPFVYPLTWIVTKNLDAIAIANINDEISQYLRFFVGAHVAGIAMDCANVNMQSHKCTSIPYNQDVHDAFFPTYPDSPAPSISDVFGSVPEMKAAPCIMGLSAVSPSQPCAKNIDGEHAGVKSTRNNGHASRSPWPDLSWSPAEEHELGLALQAEPVTGESGLIDLGAFVKSRDDPCTPAAAEDVANPDQQSLSAPRAALTAGICFQTMCALQKPVNTNLIEIFKFSVTDTATSIMSSLPSCDTYPQALPTWTIRLAQQ